MDGLVSVIIPIYKVEKYLRQCIDSVIDQTYRDVEIILVDDGSPDACPMICDEYAEKDTRVKVIHKENSGLSDARNAGFAIATGEFIYFLDSDDYLTHEAIETMVSEANDSNADFLFFDAMILVEDGFVLDQNKDIRKKSYSDSTGPLMLKKLVDNREFRSAVQYLFIRKKTLETLDLKFFSGILHEDILFTVQLYLYSGLVRHVAKVLYCRRNRAGSIINMKKNTNHFMGRYTGFVEFAKQYNDSELEPLQRNLLRYFMRRNFDITLTIYYGLSKADRASVVNERKELVRVAREMNYLSSKKVRLICINPYMHFIMRKLLSK
jgi:glycosyltransferase involved in cell wall biosynthesis